MEKCFSHYKDVHLGFKPSILFSCGTLEVFSLGFKIREELDIILNTLASTIRQDRANKDI